MLKYDLDIRKDEQKLRLAERRKDPLKQWKISPIDAVAFKHWDAYTQAREAMLLGRHAVAAPWQVVRTDRKRHARLNLMRDILSRALRGPQQKVDCAGPQRRLRVHADCLATHRLAP